MTIVRLTRPTTKKNWPDPTNSWAGLRLKFSTHYKSWVCLGLKFLTRYANKPNPPKNYKRKLGFTRSGPDQTRPDPTRLDGWVGPGLGWRKNSIGFIWSDMNMIWSDEWSDLILNVWAQERRTRYDDVWRTPYHDPLIRPATNTQTHHGCWPAAVAGSDLFWLPDMNCFWATINPTTTPADQPSPTFVLPDSDSSRTVARDLWRNQTIPICNSHSQRRRPAGSFGSSLLLFNSAIP